MNNALDSLLAAPTAFLALGIYILTFAIRRYVEALWPSLSAATPETRGQRIWENAFLPTLPSLFGLAFCLVCPPDYFAYPTIVVASVASRVLYGLVAGWFSSWAYGVVKFMLQQKWNVPLPPVN